MARYRNLKKVSWAPDGSLCQIRKFSANDCPARVGLGVDDNLQFRHSRKWQSGDASNNLSSGFLRTIMRKPVKLISIPNIKWKCPPKVDLDPDWFVASGDLSEEVGIQKKREMKVFEAVYPRRTDIPRNPSGALCLDGYVPDDRIIPTIPTTSIDDDEATMESSSVASPTPLPDVSACPPSEHINTGGCANSVQTTHAGGIQELISSTEAVIGIAASAALTALLKSNEIGSSVDTNMLIDIFNNPEMVSMLLSMTSSATTKPTPNQVIPPVNFPCSSTDVFSSTSASGAHGVSQMPADRVSTMLQPRYTADPMVSTKTVASLPTSIGGSVMTTAPLPPFRKGYQLDITHEVPSQTTSTEIKPYISSTAVTPTLRPPTQVKDANYYKNLIKQHGLDNQNIRGKIPHTQLSSPESANPCYGLTKNGQKLAKTPRPCVFYNTPRGCRKGLECPFRHDITSPYQMPAPNMTEVPNAKRMKLGRSELTSMT